MTLATATHPSRGLRDVAYWAIMSFLFACRFFFTWVYFLVSFSSFRALLQVIRESSAHFQLKNLLVFAFPAAAGLISGAAWWTTLRNSRTQRIWVILFSLGCLLSLSPWLSGRPSARYMLAYLTILVPAFGGMLVFLLPYRLRLSLNVSSYRMNSAGHRCESDLMTARSLRSRAYWAIMFLLSAGRLALIWAYWVFFEHSAEALWDVSRQSSGRFSQYGLCAMALIAGIGFTAGWTALRKSRTQRIWAIIACLVYLLGAVILLVNPSTRHSAYSREMLVIALGGMLVYLLPYRLLWSVNVFTYRMKNPDHTSRELHLSI